MTRYLIKLTPLDAFFFSQENKYRKKKGKYEADYYQKSAYFPQQTTLLGMLRYYILLINEQIPITDKQTAENLIGKQSFDIGVKNPDFKTIKNISPVFIIGNDEKIYVQNPKDLLLQNDEPVYLERKSSGIKNNLTDELQIVSNYVEKNGLSNFLIHSETDWLPMDYDEKQNPDGVFIKQEKIGITKSKSGQTLDNAFYKQVFYRLQKGYSFGFLADLKEDSLKVLSEIIPTGAEKNQFQITMKPCDKTLENEIQLKNNNAPKIVLLSDVYLSNYDPNDFQFAISSTKTFRFLKTEVREGHRYYSSNPLDNREIRRSNKYNLFEKGSVFYFKDKEQLDAFSDILNKETNFTQIGYNQHLKIY